MAGVKIRAAFVLALLACLGLPSRAQPDGRVFTVAEITGEAKRAPTTPQNVRERFSAVLDFAQASGQPGRFLKRATVGNIQSLMAAGRLADAAPLVHAVMLSLEKPQGDFAAGGPPPHMQRGMPPGGRPAPDGEIHGDQVPMMLSSPQAPAPVAPAEPAVRVRPINPFSSVPSEKPVAPAVPVAQTPKAGGTPWGWILLVASLLPVGALAWSVRRKAPPVEPQPSPADTKLSLTDKYTVGRLITSGGMGEVYEGKDLTLGRKVALKKMLPDLKLDAALRQQFLNEARTVAKLTHPYIVQIHDCMESGEDVYLVFEFVKGKTLAQILTEKPRLSLKECLKIFSHVCPAIDHAHKNHILHRDLKPANIMIDDNGISRVMDFGIALESTRTMANGGQDYLDASGTLRYMPPEQHYGKSVRASDVYAMGVCLYEMTTGTLPFAAGSVEELIEQKRNRRFPAPSTLVPALPREFDLFVTSVLAPDPQERMGSALEFLELLEGVAAA